MNMEELYEGDCLEIMRTLPSESVDMIFADPPFNLGKKYGGKPDTDKRSDYYEWCASWIEEGFRLLKPTGTFYLMTIPRHVFRMGCEMEKHGVFINKVEWRNVSSFHNKRGFWSSTQPIVVFGKTDKYKFNTYAQRRKIQWLRWGICYKAARSTFGLLGRHSVCLCWLSGSSRSNLKAWYQSKSASYSNAGQSGGSLHIIFNR
jgi:hypothetical protein